MTQVANYFDQMPGNCIVTLQINVATQQIKQRAVMIGHKLNDYVILEFGRDADWRILLSCLTESTAVIIRAVLPNGDVIAASCSYLSMTHYPRKLVFLNFPKEFEKRHLRANPRVNVELPAALTFTELSELFPQPIDSLITDLSEQGLGLQTREPITVPKEELLGKTVELAVQHNQQRDHAVLECEIRNRQLINPQLTQFGLKVVRSHGKPYESLIDIWVSETLHNKAAAL